MPSAVVVTNLLASANLSSGTVVAASPLANAVDGIAASVFKWDSLLGGYFEGDMTSAQSFDTLFVGNHNFVSTATLATKGGNTTPPATSLATPVWRSGNLWADLSTQSYRYFRLTVVDAQTTYKSGAGEIVLGLRTLLPRAHRFGKTVGVKRADIQHETMRGVKHVFTRFKRETRKYQWRVTLAELATFTALEESLQGRTTPFVWIPDTAGAECFMARLVSADFQPVELAEGDYFDVTWEIEEEAVGVDLLA